MICYEVKEQGFPITSVCCEDSGSVRQFPSSVLQIPEKITHGMNLNFTSSVMPVAHSDMEYCICDVVHHLSFTARFASQQCVCKVLPGSSSSQFVLQS